jgi:serine/threonine-protein kinase
MDLPVGTVLDHYRLTRLIGTGGMGAIYEAADVSGGRRVAVKVMSREMVAYPEALARFRREVKVTSALEHPNIVDVFDFGTSPAGQPFLVMEYLDGEDLDYRLQRERRLPLPDAVQIVKQLASALAAAHAEGIVHRDLKPGNVFLVRGGGGAGGGEVHVKVVDFGISKVLKASTTQLTVARAVFGTPEFMAPEQAAGRIDLIDHRTDQWALACVAWQMLSGQLPFWRPDVNALLAQVAAEEPNPLQGDDAALIPPELDKVLRRALSKRREDRWKTIGAFARAFESAAGAVAPARSTPAAAPAVAPAREAPPARRHRRGSWVAVTAVVFAIAVVAAGAAAWIFRADLPFARYLPGGDAPERPTHQARERHRRPPKDYP